MEGKSIKRRRYLFTLNKPLEKKDIDFNNNVVRCYCYQHEVGEKGTDHYQGYFELLRPQHLSWIKRNISNEMHVEMCFGDRKDNVHYCSKPHGPDDECYDECGTICDCKNCKKARKAPQKIKDIIFGGDWDLESGKRTDLIEFKKDIVEMSLKELWEKHYFLMLRYRNMVVHMKNDINEKYFVGIRNVILIIGRSGTGKSEMVNKEHSKIYDKSLNVKDKDYWEKYDGEEIIKFEDFTGEVEMNEMIRILDRYKVDVCKRYVGKTPFNGKVIYITTNTLPEEWYKNELNVERFNALYRRFTGYVVTKYKEDPVVSNCVNEFKDDILSIMGEEKYNLFKVYKCYCHMCNI
ncbi:MAG: Rep protein [Circoviridae sp. ctfvP2]|nr:MAG: Rep protein [Circoviridae sp. ctfvP2]UOF79957.1 rep protein [Cressdnaviricota sp.]UOF80225.1 rep protein [Cressdnaviricota sp.]UOF82581.1 rep protein [Cressdnaviricota sp.]